MVVGRERLTVFRVSYGIPHLCDDGVTLYVRPIVAVAVFRTRAFPSFTVRLVYLMIQYYIYITVFFYKVGRKS